MPRIRTIKPEFWTDEYLVELSPWARLLFIGLWNFVDDYGRMEYSPKRVKMQIFPADDVDVDALISELAGDPADSRRIPPIIVYSSEGKQYLQVTNFEKHQKVNQRSPSRYPPVICADSSEKDPLEWKGREGKGKEKEIICDAALASPSPRKNFHRPTAENVAAYCAERKNSVDAEKFLAYYDSNGWRVGRNPMRDWRAAVRTWERNSGGFGGTRDNAPVAICAVCGKKRVMGATSCLCGGAFVSGGSG